MLILGGDIPRAPGLGWLGVGGREDPRKANHPLRANRLMEVERIRRNIRYPSFSWPLDQGQTGTCVGHGGKHWEITAPVRRTKRLGPPTAIDLYLETTKRDPYHKGQPDTSLQDGTDITSLFLVFRDLYGFVSDFDWTNDIDDVLDFMCSGQGGVVLGIPWYRSMFHTTREGIVLVDLASGLAGGHCIYADEVEWQRKGSEVPMLSGPNSWGRPLDFGKLDPKTGQTDGRWRMDLNDLRRFLVDGGEAVAGRELPRAA